LPNVVQVACGLEHSIAITSEGKMYSWGSNVVGQLGMHDMIICILGHFL
jgi:alpha-tubulin suppressor-like RCC1 family protein